jgi:Ca2+/Na+ antiporter
MRTGGMTRKTKIVILLFSLILPYVALAAYMGFTLRGNTVPMWFLYAALCYLVAAVFVFIIGRKRIIASSPAPDMAEQKKQNISGAKAVRRLGYIWLIGPLFYLLDGGLKANPAWVTFLGFSWAGFLSWASFHQAKKMELKARQDSQA